MAFYRFEFLLLLQTNYNFKKQRTMVLFLHFIIKFFIVMFFASTTKTEKTNCFKNSITSFPENFCILF